MEGTHKELLPSRTLLDGIFRCLSRSPTHLEGGSVIVVEAQPDTGVDGRMAGIDLRKRQTPKGRGRRGEFVSRASEGHGTARGLGSRAPSAGAQAVTNSSSPSMTQA